MLRSSYVHAGPCHVALLLRLSVRYCQGMNFIAGIFLMLMPEEEAFWMLAAVVEKVLRVVGVVVVVLVLVLVVLPLLLLTARGTGAVADGVELE